MESLRILYSDSLSTVSVFSYFIDCLGLFDNHLMTSFGLEVFAFKKKFQLLEVKYLSKYECLSQQFNVEFCPDTFTENIEDFGEDNLEKQKEKVAVFEKEMVRGFFNLSADWVEKKNKLEAFNKKPRMHPGLPIDIFAIPDMLSQISLVSLHSYVLSYKVIGMFNGITIVRPSWLA